MEALLKTDKTTLDEKDILQIISDYETTEASKLNCLRSYYKVENEKIISRKPLSQNTSDNKIPVGYGKKLVDTYVGYAHRPGFTSYKPKINKKAIEKQMRDEHMNEEMVDEFGNEKELEIDFSDTIEAQYCDAIQEVFDENNEQNKSSLVMKQCAMYGFAYMMLYLDSEFTGVLDDPTTPALKAKIKFYVVDPRENILIYDYSPEPKKIINIHFYKVHDKLYKVEVMYKTYVQKYNRILTDKGWTLEIDGGPIPNFFKDIPVVPYYFGDTYDGVIKPVKDLIDANDILFSDSMNEFSQYASAYLVMKGTGLTDPTKNKDPFAISLAIKLLKQYKLFERVPKDAEISFLTKDIPTAFITFMKSSLKDEIHTQSHIPDFTNLTGGISGEAIKRLIFDLENLVSFVESNINIATYELIGLITNILVTMDKFNKDDVKPSMILIDRKRNIPENITEIINGAVGMKNAGFSRKAIVDFMPDSIIPDTEEELRLEKMEQEEMMSSFDQYSNMNENNVDENVNPEDEPIPEGELEDEEAV